MRATPEKGEEALERFSDHLVRAIDEFRRSGPRDRERSRSAFEHPPPALRRPRS
jgi:creatinine amidohydrolase